MASETTRRPARGAGGEAVSEDELQAIEELWRQEPKTGWPDLLVDVVPELVAEVRRLVTLAADIATERDFHAKRVDMYAKALGDEQVDNKRLRDLVWRMRSGAGEQCLWCSRRGLIEPHADDCPAFTPGGGVR